MAFLPNGDFRITERAGELQRLRPNGSRVSLKGVPDTYFAGQGGFFDIVLDSSFEQNKTVYLHEHGPRVGDELNLVLPGKNYGWPAVTEGVDYSGAYVSPFTEHPDM